MDAIAKQGLEFLKREGRRVQNLLKGKVKNIYSCKLNDDNRHANAEGIFLTFIEVLFLQISI
jgi:hypothetical protein